MKENFEHLLSPLRLGAIDLRNRVIMAPLTRARTEINHIPTDLMAKYYEQRSSAGLIIAEATMAMPDTCAFINEPGIYSKEQIQAWKKITDAVHSKGGRIVLQIWHGGRACHPDLNDGKEAVAPSAIAIEGETHTPNGSVHYTVPHALSDEEIPSIIEGFKQAAMNAKLAGFDGVEVHGANGYLLDQFLRDGSNKRTGLYGGSIENRARLLIEVLNAVIDIWGSDRVGVRISPINSFNSMIDSNPRALTKYLCERLNKLNLAYLHIMRRDFFAKQTDDVISVCEETYEGNLIANMGYDAIEAEEAIKNNKLKAVAFGVPFISNPDFPARIKAGVKLNDANPETFYTSGPVGYTDYPFFN